MSMRKYRPKNDLQKKEYYQDRFFDPGETKKEVPKDKYFKKVIDRLNVFIAKSYVETGSLVIWIEKNNLRKVVEILKNELEVDFLSDMSAIDFIAERGEFELFYQFYSTTQQKRIRIKFSIKEKEEVDTIEDIFKSANWAERECFDMFGIRFKNHPNLKRILMPDDWVGFPLRKDYPMQGDEYARWYEVDKIFGKEAREVIGEEIRDQAYIDPKRKEKFLHIDLTEEYQEEEGVFLITKFKRKLSKILNYRK